MNRRTFLLLTGATSGALLGPPLRGASAAMPVGAAGRLRFSLDEHRRWSLWYQTAGAPVPLIERAELGAWIAERFVTLGDLEDTAIGTRRPPAGESLVVRGRGGGIWVEAEFLAGPPHPTPRATITVSLYPDRSLPACRGVRFFVLPGARILPGAAPLQALTNGYAAADPSRVVHIDPTAGSWVSHGTIGLTRGHRALGLAFDAGEPGESRVELNGGALDATSAWRPTRPLRPEGDRATLRLCYQDPGHGLAALAALFEPMSAVDRERLDAVTVPAGWHAAAPTGTRLTEADVLHTVASCAARFDRRYVRYIRLGDGYQRALGDWDTHAGFPAGHRGITEQIHARGLRAALWIAPFAVTAASGIPEAHPDWLLQDDRGPLVVAAEPAWDGPVYGLDGAHPDVQHWLYTLARTAVREWGYDSIATDGLGWSPHSSAHYGGRTHAEASRRGLAAVRDGLGPDTFLLAAGGPLQHAVGLANGARVAGGVEASWGGIQRGARAAALRSFYQRGAWINDPGDLHVGEPLSTSEVRAWASVVALSGGAVMAAGDLTTVSDERVAIVQRTVPAAGTGRPGDALTAERVIAPALLTDDAVIPLNGPWRFRTGDDASYARRDYADDLWESIPVPGPWEDGGRPTYDGFAWYRTQVTLPSATAAERPRARVWLELGKIDDADETFVNGVRVGGRGALSPGVPSARDDYRRYPVDPGALTWGGDNVVAIRVFDTGSPGRVWDARRDRPAAVWVTEGAPRWWTVALINWDDEPREVAVTLADLGIAAGRLHAYDVWRDLPMADIRTRLSAHLDPHDVLVVGLRPAPAHPQVVGTTRHVIQGALDVVDEAWDATQRTLRGRATRLDDRAYAVTVAAPPTHQPADCAASRPCTLRHLASAHVVIEWPADTEGGDLEWALRFHPRPAP